MKRLSILVLWAFLAVLVGTTTGRSADDKVAESLEKAKTKFEAEMKKARATAKEDLDKKLKTAREKGKKDLVDKIKDEQKAFEQHGILSASAPQELQRTVKAQRTAIETAYSTAIKAYTKAKKDDLAAAVEKEWKQLQTDGLVSVAPPGDLWRSLFNGKDLEGWTSHQSNHQQFWKVIDGAIQAENKNKNGEPNYLATTYKDFSDFHIRTEIMYMKDCIASLGFRGSERGSYIVPICSGARHTGTVEIFTKTINRNLKLAPGPSPPAKEWFTLEIIARGHSFTTLINGEKIVDAIDEDKTLISGGLGLSVSEQGSVLRIRKIEIMPLPSLLAEKK